MAAGSTYTPIATNTLSSTTASVTFSSISGSYTDLVLVVTPVLPSGNYDVFARIGNGTVDSGANYSVSRIYSTGSAPGSSRGTNQGFLGCTYYAYATTANPSITTINFMNYANTTTYKTALVRSSNGTTGADAIIGLWRSTAAINTITVFLDGSANFTSGSTFTLYGIAAA